VDGVGTGSSTAARGQIASSAEVANKQITAPMRQVWINSLRDLVAELTSDTLHYFTAGHNFEGYENFKRAHLSREQDSTHAQSE
jgi:hypothetical protein